MLLYVMVIQEQHHNKQVNIYKQLKHIGVNVIQGVFTLEKSLYSQYRV